MLLDLTFEVLDLRLDLCVGCSQRGTDTGKGAACFSNMALKRQVSLDFIDLHLGETFLFYWFLSALLLVEE